MSSMYGSSGQTGRGMTGGALQRGTPSRDTPSGYERLSNFTPEQMQLFQQLFSHLGPNSYLSKLAGGDQSLFGEIEAPALKQFAGLQGNIASRFSGMGSGAQRSSGFQNTMNQASSDFASKLQSQRQGMQQNAIRDLLGMGNQLLGQEAFSFEPKQKPFWQEMLLSLAQNSGEAAKFAAMFAGA